MSALLGVRLIELSLYYIDLLEKRKVILFIMCTLCTFIPTRFVNEDKSQITYSGPCENNNVLWSSKKLHNIIQEVDVVQFLSWGGLCKDINDDFPQGSLVQGRRLQSNLNLGNKLNKYEWHTCLHQVYIFSTASTCKILCKWIKTK